MMKLHPADQRAMQTPPATLMPRRYQGSIVLP
jgi:hypothetical protein